MVTSTENFILAEFQFYSEVCANKYMKNLSKADRTTLKLNVPVHLRRMVFNYL